MDQRATEALGRLREGNRRFVADRPVSAAETSDAARRAELVPAQRPFAAVLACADSRVPPELVFDQGLGELFVVRVAGHVAGDSQLDSLDFAVELLGCPLVVVLGHERCGAVEAALAADAAGRFAAVVGPIRETLGDGPVPADPADAERANVAAVVERVRTRIDRVPVVGAWYELATGAVHWLDDGAGG